MKIAIVNNFFLPRPGGSSIFSYSMAREFVKQGHDVLVITAAYRDQRMNEVIEGIQVVRVPAWTMPATPLSFNFDINFALLPGNSRRVRRLLEEFEPEVIHSHGQFFDLTWKALRWARNRAVPVVLTLHTRLVSTERVTGRIFALLDRTVVVPMLRRGRVDAMVIIDKTFKSYVRDRYSKVTSHLAEIPISVDWENFGGQVRSDSSLEPYLITSVGHVISVRNRLDLVKAIPKVQERFPNVRVRVIGHIYHAKFLGEVERLSLEGTFDNVGAVSREEVPRLLAESALEVHDTQGFGIGIATLEAMAMGIPVVVSDDPDYFLVDSLQHKHNCYIISPNSPDELAEAILWYFEDMERMKRVGLAGRDFVFRNLRQDIVASKYLHLFAALTNR